VRPRAKVTKKSIDTKIKNDLDFCLEVVSTIKAMSTTALHSTLNISETIRDRGLVPKGTPTGNGI